jgi:hypothetical protein
MPDMMPLVLCGACLIVVLENSEKARGIYNQIVESYRRPELQAAFNARETELRPTSPLNEHGDVCPFMRTFWWRESGSKDGYSH